MITMTEDKVLDEKLVAYCGLYCPKCYKMVVSQAAESLKDALENTHIYGSVNDASSQFKAELNKLVSLRCLKVCKEDGGKPTCKIRKCCVGKRLNGCWECNDFERCKNLKEQFVNNIKNIRKLGISGFIVESD